MTDVQIDEAATQAAEQARLNERYFKIADLLCYSFKMPSPYGSRRVRVKGRTRERLFRETIYPIAYRGPNVYEMFPGVISASGSNQVFLWMAGDGTLIVRELDGYETVSLDVMIASISDQDYELLILWLSNDATGALALIEKQREDEIRKMWPELPAFNPGNYA